MSMILRKTDYHQGSTRIVIPSELLKSGTFKSAKHFAFDMVDGVIHLYPVLTPKLADPYTETSEEAERRCKKRQEVMYEKNS